MMTISGDTLYDIAQRYNLSVRDIIDVNGLSPPFVLGVHQRLKLPAPRTYTVQAGDTLYRISRMFGVDSHELARSNGLKSPYVLSSGQQLRLPSGKPLPPVKEASVLAPPPDAGLMRWPVKGRIISQYGAKPDGLYNDGINISAPKGAPVIAADDGTVVYAGTDLASYGKLILIRHKSGYMTAYAHLSSIKAVKGSPVLKGQMIGAVGTSGNVKTPQLHFEVRRKGDTVDPVRMLDS